MQEKNQKKIKASGTPAKFAGYIKRSKRKSRGSFLLPFPLRTRGEKAICDGLIFFCLFSFIKARKGPLPRAGKFAGYIKRVKAKKVGALSFRVLLFLP